MEEKIELTRTELIEAIAEAFATYSEDKFEDEMEALMFSMVVGAKINHLICEKLFGKEGE